MYLSNTKPGGFDATIEPRHDSSTNVLAALEGVERRAGSGAASLREVIEGMTFGRNPRGDSTLSDALTMALHASPNLAENVQALFLLKAAGEPVERSEIEAKLDVLAKSVHGMQTSADLDTANRLLALDWGKLLDALES